MAMWKQAVKQAVLGSALAASAVAGLAPAGAQWHGGYRGGGYRGGYGDRGYGYRGDGGAGIAAVAGIAGLAIGAAIASDHRYDRDRYAYYHNRGYAYDYDDRYYRARGFYPADGYWAYRYRAYPACHLERRFDPYYGPVDVRVCY